MKIVHVIGDGRLRGAGLQLSYLAAALSREFEVEVVAPTGAPIFSRLAGEPLLTTALPISGRTGFCFSDIRRFEAYFLRTKPDIVHTHGSFAARVGAALAGVPHLISTRHGFPDGRARLRRLRAKLYNAFTALTVTTAYVGGRHLFAEGIPRERVITIPSGVPKVKREDEATCAALREALGIPRDAIVIGSFSEEKKAKGGLSSFPKGRADRTDGQDVLLRAFARVAAKCPNTFLLLVGVGEGEGELRRLSSLLGIGEKVAILPRSADAALCAGLLTLHVDPSRGSEHSALTACSLMSLGVPTVATDTVGMREVIYEGDNGLLFPADNSYALSEVILTLLSSAGRMEALSRGAAARYTSDFSVPRMECSYASLYRRIVTS